MRAGNGKVPLPSESGKGGGCLSEAVKPCVMGASLSGGSAPVGVKAPVGVEAPGGRERLRRRVGGVPGNTSGWGVPSPSQSTENNFD